MDHKGCNCDWCQDARQIKKGDKFLCTEDVIMDGGRHDSDCAYKSGKTYISERDGAITDEWGDKEHWWDIMPPDNWELYFRKLEGWEAVDKDYFQSMQEEYGRPAGHVGYEGTELLISQECDSLKELLISKNQRYGDSAIHRGLVYDLPATTAIKARINDKVLRLRNLQDDESEDVVLDLLGYFILLRIAQKKEEQELADAPMFPGK